jgi:hypothetical protein
MGFRMLQFRVRSEEKEYYSYNQKYVKKYMAIEWSGGRDTRGGGTGKRQKERTESECYVFTENKWVLCFKHSL